MTSTLSSATSVNAAITSTATEKPSSPSDNFGALFSNALENSKLQLLNSSSLGIRNPSSTQAKGTQGERPGHNPSVSRPQNLLDESINQRNQDEIENGQQVGKSNQAKHIEEKKQVASASHKSSTQNNEPSPQANANKVDPSQNVAPFNPNPTPNVNGSTDSDHNQDRALSVNQETFFARQNSVVPGSPEASTAADNQIAGITNAGLTNVLSSNIQASINNTPFTSPDNALSGISKSTVLSLSNISNLGKFSAPNEAQFVTEPQGENSALGLESEVLHSNPATSTTLNIAPALGESPWAAALGQQALFIAKNQMGSAQLTLNPQHLGPIQVTLDLKHDQANAVFVSPHDAVRQAIEASLPQLRDMFTQAGLNLGQAQVQADLSGQFTKSSDQNSGSSANRRSSTSESDSIHEAGAVSHDSNLMATQGITRGLLDTFA